MLMYPYVYVISRQYLRFFRVFKYMLHCVYYVEFISHLNYMKYRHFPFTRNGNKTNDLKFIVPHVNLSNITKIVEPFCGTFAFSRFYLENGKYKYHLNDNDVDFIKSIMYFFENYEYYSKTLSELVYCYNNREYTNNIYNLDFPDYVIRQLIELLIIRGITKKLPTLMYTDLVDCYGSMTFTTEDYKVITDKYKDDKQAFLFIDPPYLLTDSSQYQNQKDLTDIVVHLIEYIKTCKCKVMIVINSSSINKYLFKDYIKTTYKRIYQHTKNKDELMVVTNY